MWRDLKRVQLFSGAIDEKNGLRWRNVPDGNVSNTVAPSDGETGANRVRAGISRASGGLSRIRNHDEARGSPAPGIARRLWRIQIGINQDVAAPERCPMSVDDAQYLLIVENARPRDQ